MFLYVLSMGAWGALLVLAEVVGIDGFEEGQAVEGVEAGRVWTGHILRGRIRRLRVHAAEPGLVERRRRGFAGLRQGLQKGLGMRPWSFDDKSKTCSCSHRVCHCERRCRLIKLPL